MRKLDGRQRQTTFIVTTAINISDQSRQCAQTEDLRRDAIHNAPLVEILDNITKAATGFSKPLDDANLSPMLGVTHERLKLFIRLASRLNRWCTTRCNQCNEQKVTTTL
ncbi:unnamed protein product [Clavelina lepadiformis]|uniref:Uncharacterized protein n=1 Tax=Clavelina lepadiformis TaxID=159417 RepID=A0ABP0EV34_CLALP